MSVSGVGSGLSSPGLGSGLDVNSIVSQLMTVEQQPLVQLNKKEAKYQTQLTDIGAIKGALSALQTAAQAIGTSTKFSPTKASVGNPGLFTALPSATASTGNYTVEVQKLAQSQKLMTQGYADTISAVGSGTLTIDFGSYSTDGMGVTSFAANATNSTKTVTLDATNNSLSGIRDAINKANIGVTATIINDGSTNGNRLELTSNSTGASNSMRIGVTEGTPAGLANLAYDASTGATSNQTQLVASQDAVIKVDTVTITKPSNNITDAIQGVTLNLNQASIGTTTQLSLTRDTSTVQTAIQGFVDAYNSLNKLIATDTAYNVTTGVAGSLNGDGTIRSIQTQVRNIFTHSVAGATAGMSTLSDIGIHFQDDGSLNVLAPTLASSLANPNKDLSQLFAQTSTTTGYASQIDTLMSGMLSATGLVAGHTTGINSSIKDIETQKTSLNVRLASIEKRYRAQFTALDTAVASMNQTSTFLTQQLTLIANQSKSS
jgi:flagellar hook-associated protein 2